MKGNNVFETVNKVLFSFRKSSMETVFVTNKNLDAKIYTINNLIWN